MHILKQIIYLGVFQITFALALGRMKYDSIIYQW